MWMVLCTRLEGSNMTCGWGTTARTLAIHSCPVLKVMLQWYKPLQHQPLDLAQERWIQLLLNMGHSGTIAPE